MKFMAIAVIFLAGLLGQTETDREKIEKVVRESNRLEVILYQNPNDDELLKQFKATVVEGGPRDQDVSDRVARARKAGRKTLNATHNIDKLTFTELKETSAVVDTEETGGHEWSDNASPPFRQNHRPHTYYLKKTGGKWVIDEEEMHPQP